MGESHAGLHSVPCIEHTIHSLEPPAHLRHHQREEPKKGSRYGNCDSSRRSTRLIYSRGGGGKNGNQTQLPTITPSQPSFPTIQEHINQVYAINPTPQPSYDTFTNKTQNEQKKFSSQAQHLTTNPTRPLVCTHAASTHTPSANSRSVTIGNDPNRRVISKKKNQSPNKKGQYMRTRWQNLKISPDERGYHDERNVHKRVGGNRRTYLRSHGPLTEQCLTKKSHRPTRFPKSSSQLDRWGDEIFLLPEDKRPKGKFPLTLNGNSL